MLPRRNSVSAEEITPRSLSDYRSDVCLIVLCAFGYLILGSDEQYPRRVAVFASAKSMSIDIRAKPPDKTSAGGDDQVIAL
jgi:hypothetical protein